MGNDRMKKTKYIILAFMFLFPVVSFCEERIMSLEDCLKMAQNSPEIKIQDAKISAKRIYTITAKGKVLLGKWAKSIFEKRTSLNKFLSGYEKIKKGE